MSGGVASCRLSEVSVVESGARRDVAAALDASREDNHSLLISIRTTSILISLTTT